VRRRNSSEIGRSLGEAHTTVKRHLDALSGALVARVLAPWYANVGKRLWKSPKAYIRDSGLLHTLLGIGDRRQLDGHPVVGGSWERFIIEKLLAHAAQGQSILLANAGRRTTRSAVVFWRTAYWN
jgi:predicted AAA+ superfamily ATPase